MRWAREAFRKGLHHRGDQFIRLPYGLSRVVDKADLDGIPIRAEGLRRLGREQRSQLLVIRFALPGLRRSRAYREVCRTETLFVLLFAHDCVSICFWSWVCMRTGWGSSTSSSSANKARK